jgi:PAS domain-containing protein
VLSWLTPGRGPIIGALVGTTTAVVALWLTGSADRAVPYTVLLVLAIAIVGLMFGASAAAWAWLSALAVVAVGLVVTEAGNGWSSGEVIRLAAFIIGSPLIVLLVHRSEFARRTAVEALAESRRAQDEAAEERRQLELARLDVGAALASAERERTRLEEVAEAIPEPLVVFDHQLRGTYGNRAALRLFGRSFVERPLDEWGRATEPRDERGLAAGPGADGAGPAPLHDPGAGIGTGHAGGRRRHADPRRRRRPHAPRRGQGGGRTATALSLRELRRARAAESAGGGKSAHRAGPARSAAA